MTIIDAGSAKLAGLQIDTLTKYRAGQLTLDQWERFNNLSPGDREARFGDWKKSEPKVPAKAVEKFALLADLGPITVPDGQVPGTCLATFKAKHQGGRKKSFYSYNDNISDENFTNPTRILKPGDKLHVRAWKQIVKGTTTSDERMDFLATHKSVYTGAQGASLVFEQKRDQLPKGYWYASFDEKKRLWEDAHGDHRVPSVDAFAGGGFSFSLGFFESDWDGVSAFLGFCDV